MIIMHVYLVPAVLSFILTFSLAFAARSVNFRQGSGGAIVFLVFAVTSAVFLYNQEYNFWMIFWGLVFVLFGLMDNKGTKVLARHKVWSHLLFAGLFVVTAKTSLQFVRFEWVNFLLSVGFITFMANSLNLLEGMDGLVGGISAIVSFFFFILAFKNEQAGLAVLSLIIIGTCLGFLFYNMYGAKISLGKSGTSFLGYILAVMVIFAWNMLTRVGV